MGESSPAVPCRPGLRIESGSPAFQRRDLGKRGGGTFGCSGGRFEGTGGCWLGAGKPGCSSVSCEAPGGILDISYSFGATIWAVEL